MIIVGAGLLVLGELLLDHIPADGVWWCGEANGLTCLDAMAQAQLADFESAAAQADAQAKAERGALIRERARLAQREVDSIHLYRGVTVGHEGYGAATRGVAVPIGGHDDPQRHNSGDTNSIYTSWTTRIPVARYYAMRNGSGVIMDAWISRSRVLDNTSIDQFNESEWLVIGPVFGADVTFVP
jgi:hypothetical protein